MHAICERRKTVRRWRVFDTESERDATFLSMKDRASVTGCGGQCDCFRDNGNSFIHCGEWETYIVEELDMKD